jgi:four helix bundle protein
MMAKENLIEKMSFEFALDVINLYKAMVAQNEFVISKQVFRAGTSIGANVNEAQAGQSRRDFASKMAIASKEAREAKYWLRLIKDGKIWNGSERVDELLAKVDSVINILTRIVKTSEEKRGTRERL